MSELEPRITGTELELALLLKNTKGDFDVPIGGVTGSILSSGLPSYLDRVNSTVTNYFTANGARIYVDVGGHIEVATPEDNSLWGTVANEIALETIMIDTLDRYCGQTAKGAYRLHKRVIDSNDVSWGYHENYYLPGAEGIPSKSSLSLVAGHLATRQIFTGAGYQTRDGDFKLSQKLQTVAQGFSSTTTANKPLINTRDQPHTGDKKDLGARLHITCGDSNMSPWASFMKLATTSIVLRLVEEGQTIIPYLGSGSNYPKMAHVYNGDPTLTATVPLNGRQMTALNVQEALVAKAVEFSERVELPPEEVEALGWWINIVDDLRVNPAQTTDRIEWIAKHKAIQRYSLKHGLSNDDPRLSGIDWRWDLVDEDGVGMQLRKTAWSEWYDSALIEERIKSPPSETRATPRSLFIRSVQELGSEAMKDATVDWDRLRLGSESILLSNPRSNDCAQVEKLLATAA